MIAKPQSALAAGALLVSTALVLTACGSSGKSAQPGGSSSSAGDPHTVAITITAAGCAPTTTTHAAGPLTFKISNKDATAVSELELLSGQRIVGEKENLPPGLSGSFALSLDPGDYVVYCPGASKEKNTIKVTGTAASTASTDTHTLLVQGAADYAKYVNTQVDALLVGVQALDATLKGSDLSAAQNAYKKSRVFYERIEPVAESFTTDGDDLDGDIDARADDVPVEQLTGFHSIEYGLFDVKSLAGLASYGDGLVSNVQKLQKLTSGLTYQPAELANGAVELLDEVSKSKVTGEEERYSHIDLLDFSGNVEGAEQAFACLLPALTKIDSGLATQITTGFTALDAALDKYRSSTDASGFALYATLTDADKTALTQALQAVAEPLSTVAGKVVNS
jgi:iron uptake system component EfeO